MNNSKKEHCFCSQSDNGCISSLSIVVFFLSVQLRLEGGEGGGEGGACFKRQQKGWRSQSFLNYICSIVQRANYWTKLRQKFSSLLFTVTFTLQLSLRFLFLQTQQPLTVSASALLYTVKEREGKPDRKPYPLPCVFINPYRNLKSEN